MPSLGQGGLLSQDNGDRPWAACAPGHCMADDLASERLEVARLVEVYCLCKGTREWIMRREAH